MSHGLLLVVLALSYPLSLVWAFRNKQLWRLGLVLNSLLVYFLGYCQFYIFLVCVMLALLPYVTGLAAGSRHLQLTVKFSITLLALLLGFHLIPGFGKLVFFHSYTLSSHSAAFDVAYPLDKAFGVLLLLGYGIAFSASRLPAIKLILITTLLILFAVSAFAIPIGYLSPDVKLKWPILIWAYGNLFITSTAEEVFFRGIVQYQVFIWLKDKTKYAIMLALFTASLIFALAHYAGGIDYMVIAFIAGLGYGAIYAKTRNLLDSILVHFLANLTHIILFTYPHLISAY